MLTEYGSPLSHENVSFIFVNSVYWNYSFLEKIIIGTIFFFWWGKTNAINKVNISE